MTIERDQSGRVKVRPRPKRAPLVRRPEVPDGHGVTRNVQAMCTARRTDGEPCRAYAIRGSNVCARHGGMAPQVRRAAAVRLAMAQDWLMEELLKIIRSTEDEKTKLTAILAALDRGGFNPKTNLEIEVGARTLSKFEETMNKAITIKRISADDSATADEGDDVVDAEVVSEVPEPYRPEPRPVLAAPREQRVDVNPPLPSYLDPHTGGKRRPGQTRTTEMTR